MKIQAKTLQSLTMDTSGFNPYMPPSAPSSDASLASDTEFLFNDRVIAGTRTIVLPQVCVVTGSTDSLLARESQLSWCPRWITVSRTLMIFAAVFIGLPMLLNLPPVAPGLRALPEVLALLQLAFGTGIILAAVILVIATYVVRTSIQVRWFISRRAAARSFRLAVVGMVLLIGVTIGIIRWAPAVGAGILGVPAIWVFVSIIQLTRGKRVLFVADQQEGLFLIGGVSGRFLTKIKRMAEEYTAGTGS